MSDIVIYDGGYSDEQRQADTEAHRANAEALAAAATAKAAALTSARAKLAALGLTPDEIAAFLG